MAAGGRQALGRPGRPGGEQPVTGRSSGGRDVSRQIFQLSARVARIACIRASLHPARPARPAATFNAPRRARHPNGNGPFRAARASARPPALTSSPSARPPAFCFAPSVPPSIPVYPRLPPPPAAPSASVRRPPAAAPPPRPARRDPMALGGSTARPLLVPAADVLAKNMRALESSRKPPAAAASDAGGAPSGKRRAFIGLGAATEQSELEAHTQIRFRRAPDPPSASPLAALLARLSRPPAPAAPDAPPAQASPLTRAFAKVLPPLEKAAAIASRLPDPTLLFLALVLVVLLVERARPHWLHPPLAKAALLLSFLPLFALALLWRKTELFATLREGQNPLSHPAEHRLDGLEADLAQREQRVKKAQEELRKHRAQLDALRKELAKDPHARDPDAVIIPSRKAAAMIAAGALGAGYDAEAAQAVEQRRKEESVKRSREEWRARTEETEDNVNETKESLKLMADHAATAYTKRTRELKTKSGGGGPLRNAERFMNLRKTMSVRREDPATTEEGAVGHRLSRQSERSVAESTTQSVGSNTKRRLNFFRKKKRVPQITSGGDDEGLQPSSDSSRVEAEAT